MGNKVKIALLIGKGSRVPGMLQCAENLASAEVVYILSCSGEGIGTEAARGNGISSGIIRLQDFGRSPEDRERFSRTVAGLLRRRKIDLIIMAGWMIVMPPSFIQEFKGRIVNIHPSILPAYPGKGENVIPAQWRDKAAPAGCTLHYVDEGVDTGKPILFGYIAEKRDDYQKFSSFKEFERALHAKEDEVLCEGIKKTVGEWNWGKE